MIATDVMHGASRFSVGRDVSLSRSRPENRGDLYKKTVSEEAAGLPANFPCGIGGQGPSNSTSGIPVSDLRGCMDNRSNDTPLVSQSLAARLGARPKNY